MSVGATVDCIDPEIAAIKDDGYDKTEEHLSAKQINSVVP